MEDIKFKSSASPQISNKSSTRKIMLDVIIALIPCFIAGIIYFGIKAVFVVAIAIVSSFASEVIFNLCRKQTFRDALNTDLTSVVTGFLIGLSLNANSVWYIPILASIFAIVIVKMLFGGTGNNIVNPAIAGRCFVFISFLGSATSNMANNWLVSGQITTGATPVVGLLTDGVEALTVSNLELFFGTNIPGCIGETCKIAIIIGFLYLIVRKVIDFKWPLIYVVVTGLFTVVLKGFDFAYFLPSILSGGLMFVAVFMATDYVTTPNTTLGNYIYFVAIGLLTAGLRLACKIEVVTFAVLLMNFLVPLLDKWIIPKSFGAQKADNKVKEVRI